VGRTCKRSLLISAYRPILGPAKEEWVRRTNGENASKGRSRTSLGQDEREELLRLQRENRILREEREILKKAAAFFAQETNRTR
jgi:transposase